MTEKTTPGTEHPLDRDLGAQLNAIRQEDVPERLHNLALDLQRRLREDPSKN